MAYLTLLPLVYNRTNLGLPTSKFLSMNFTAAGQYHGFVKDVEIDPAEDSPGIFLGNISRLLLSGPGAITDPGHVVGHLTLLTKDSPGNCHLSIAQENKNITSQGTTANQYGTESNLEVRNSSTATLLIGFNSTLAVMHSLATVGLYVGVQVQAPGLSAGAALNQAIGFRTITIPNLPTTAICRGVDIADQGTGSGGGMTAFYANIATGPGKRFVYGPGTARSFFGGDIAIGEDVTGAAVMCNGALGFLQGFASPPAAVANRVLQYYNTTSNRVEWRRADGLIAQSGAFA